GRIGSARRRLDVLDVLEIPLEFGKKRGLGGALQHFAKKDTARCQHFTGETGRGFGEGHDAQMIGLAVPGRVWRPIGENDIDFGFSAVAEHCLEPAGRGRVEEIELQEVHAVYRFEIEDIERQYAALGADTARGDFAPAARCSAEIDNAGARLEYFVTIVDFG